MLKFLKAHEYGSIRKLFESLVLGIILFGLLLFGSLFFLSQISLAQTESTFTIGQTVFGGPDVDPPTVPQNLVASAVSTSQINLSWDASLDNVGVTGYKIFRDNVEIDTTADTFYSDTGLTADTTYSYNVSAFDAVSNESAQSNTAEATTFAAEVSPPAPSGPSGGLIPLEIVSFLVEPDLNSALINLKTNLPTSVLIQWGETSDYEIGSLQSPILRANHSLLIPDLEPGRNYFFRVEVTDVFFRKLSIEGQNFTTLAPDIPELPLNVTDLKAESDEEEITLTWRNPKTNFKSVRIIRSTKFFPGDPFDGELVYQNRGEIFIDRDVQDDVVYYYAVFVEGSDGTYSSGALTYAKLFDGEPLPSDLFAGVIDLPPSEVHPLINKLTLKDFKFIQDGRIVEFVDEKTVLLKGDRSFKVSVSYDKFPEVLKTIAVALRDPEDPEKFFNFLLRVNQDRSAFEASIAPLGREGVFGLNVSVLDHRNRGLKKLNGLLKTTLPLGPIAPVPERFPQTLYFWLPFLLFLLLPLFMILKFILKKITLTKQYEITG